jgi:hypothetical protein
MEEVAMERGKEIGKEIGALQNARDYVKMVLKMRLRQIPLEIQQSVDEISVLSVLDELLKSALTVNSLEEFKQSLEQLQ